MSKHQRKQSAKAAKAQAPASAATADTDRALHTVHVNSFVGFGGSDVGNRGERDISKHYGDVTDRNDVGICGKLGGEGSGRRALDGQLGG